MNFRILISGVFFHVLLGLSASPVSQLSKADSLFQAEKYTAAFEMYESILESGTHSPAMLARMAFIREGLGDFTGALYYLDRYYQLSGNKAALVKMTELGASKNLVGYEQNDAAFLLHQLKNYRLQILLGLCSLIFLLFVLMLRASRKNGKPYGLVTAQVILMVILTVISNDLLNTQYAITNSTQTILMEGPSPGSNAIAAIGKGNKIVVVNSDPIWTRVKLNENEGYIRTHQLMML